MQATIFETE